LRTNEPIDLKFYIRLLVMFDLCLNKGFFFPLFTTHFIGQYMAKFSAKKHIFCETRYQKFKFSYFLKSFVQAQAILMY